MNEIRVTILKNDSNIVKTFIGDDAFKQAASYFARLAGLTLVDKKNDTATVKVVKVLSPKKIIAKIVPKKSKKSK